MIWIELLSSKRAAFNAKFGVGEAQSIFRIIKEDVLQEEGIPMHEPLEPEDIAYLNKIFDTILEGEPVQYVIGLALFDGMKLKVSPAVLIPRPETEELLFWAKELIADNPEGRYLDIGTGSGCLALGMKNAQPEANILALDKSSKALDIALENSQYLSLPIDFFQIDILSESAWARLSKFDGIVSNPPYIPLKEMEVMGEGVLKYEPEMALMVPDEDPLIFYKAITKFAQEKLNSGGWLLVEINEFLGEQTKELFINMGFKKVELRQDMSGKDRMIYGEKI